MHCTRAEFFGLSSEVSTKKFCDSDECLAVSYRLPAVMRSAQTYSQLTNAALAGALVSSHARSCGVAQRRPAVFLPQDGVVSGGRLARGPGELARRCRHCRRRDCSRSDAVAGRAARGGEATTCLRMRGGAARCLQRGMPRRQRERLAYFYVKTTTRPDTLIFLRQLLPPSPAGAFCVSMVSSANEVRSCGVRPRPTRRASRARARATFSPSSPSRFLSDQRRPVPPIRFAPSQLWSAHAAEDDSSLTREPRHT